MHKFLSTLSLRRATTTYTTSATAGKYFYPRSPCGERHIAAICFKSSFPISIHALLAESDVQLHAVGAVMPISIHALLAESDGAGAGSSRSLPHFYPRSPCGERHCCNV